MGFAEEDSHPPPGGLLPHHFTLTETLRSGGILSVALSLSFSNAHGVSPLPVIPAKAGIQLRVVHSRKAGPRPAPG